MLNPDNLPITDPDVLADLQRLAERKMAPEEAFEQRVSFVYGQLGHGSSVTKETIRRMLRAQDMGEAINIVRTQKGS